MHNESKDRNRAADRYFERRNDRFRLNGGFRAGSGGEPVSYDDVIEFHLWLKGIRGIGPADRDFFKKVPNK